MIDHNEDLIEAMNSYPFSISGSYPNGATVRIELFEYDGCYYGRLRHALASAREDYPNDDQRTLERRVKVVDFYNMEA